MIQLLEKDYAFPVQRVRTGIIPLFSRQPSQVSECAGNAPTITELPKDRQALFVQCARGCGVTLIACDIPLVVKRPGDTCPISQPSEDGKALCVKGARALIVSLQFDDIRQVAESASDGFQVA